MTRRAVSRLWEVFYGEKTLYQWWRVYVRNPLKCRYLAWKWSLQ